MTATNCQGFAGKKNSKVLCRRISFEFIIKRMNKKRMTTAMYTKEVSSVWLDINTDVPPVVMDGKSLYYT